MYEEAHLYCQRDCILPTSPLMQIMDCDESVESGLVKLRERLQVTLKKVHIRACHF